MGETKLLEIRYIGRVKNRPDGSQTAFGLSSGRWSVAITKAALYAYFGLSSKPGEATTLYNVLGVAQDAAQEDVKKSYKRLAKQWHPDISKEPGSREQFEAIQNAYSVLSTKRAKYDAGLALQASLIKAPNATDFFNQEYGYRSPLRCGWILGEGSTKAGKFVVEKIWQWEDITNAIGQTLIVSWVMGEDKHRETWV